MKVIRLADTKERLPFVLQGCRRTGELSSIGVNATGSPHPSWEGFLYGSVVHSLPEIQALMEKPEQPSTQLQREVAWE